MKNHRVALSFVLLLGALGGMLDGSLALIAIDQLAQSEEYMDKIETYRGFEIRAFAVSYTHLTLPTTERV